MLSDPNKSTCFLLDTKWWYTFYMVVGELLKGFAQIINSG